MVEVGNSKMDRRKLDGEMVRHGFLYVLSRILTLLKGLHQTTSRCYKYLAQTFMMNHHLTHLPQKLPQQKLSKTSFPATAAPQPLSPAPSNGSTSKNPLTNGLMKPFLLSSMPSPMKSSLPYSLSTKSTTRTQIKTSPKLQRCKIRNRSSYVLPYQRYF